MNGLNRVNLIGHCGADPDLRTTAGGLSVVQLSLATPRAVKRDNQWVEETDWHRVTAFGRTAEYLAQYAQKGSLIGIDGSLRPKSWVDKNGDKRFTVEIHVDTVLFLKAPKPKDPTRTGFGERNGDSGYGPVREDPRKTPPPFDGNGPPFPDPSLDDDIPF